MLRIILILVILFPHVSTAHEIWRVSGTEYKEFSRIADPEIVIYSENDEVVYVHRGGSLAEKLELISQGKTLYIPMTEELWKEEALRKQILSQLPEDLPENKRKEILEKFIIKIKARHFQKPIQWLHIKNAIPALSESLSSKKVVYIEPDGYCDTCHDLKDEILNAKKNNNNFSFIHIKIVN